MNVTHGIRPAAQLLWALSRLAPAWRRDDLLHEWMAELHYRAQQLDAHGRLSPLARIQLLARCAGAFFHVLFLWRHEWGTDMLVQDIRHGIRLLVRRPSLSVIALLTLALAIGATTAIFGAVHAVLLKPLPYPEPDRLVRVFGLDNRRADAAPSNVSVPDVMDFGRLTQSFEAMGAHNYGGYLTVTGGGEAERVPRLLVSPGYFRVLQATPALGRLFTAEEGRPSPPALVVISDAYWRRRFGADPNVVGQPIVLSGRSVTIIGVLRRGFVHPDPRIERAPDVFTLLDPDPDMSGRGGRFVRGIARLADGVTLQQAESELVAVAARLADEYPKSNLGRSVVLRPLSDVAAGDLRQPLLVLQAATIVVLLIACANLASLLLGAGAGRAGELSVRAALGAGRMRIARQLLTESLVLAGVGGALGVGVAWLATSFLSSMAGPMLLPGQQLTLDGRVLAFAAGLTLAAGLVFGIAPALFVSRTSASGEGRRHTESGGRARLRSALVVAEVALSLTLLVGAVLLGRSFLALTSVDPGFGVDNVMTFQVAAPSAEYPEGRQQGFYAHLYDRILAMPGVESVGGVSILPLSGSFSCDGIEIVGRPAPPGQGACAEARSASPGYFETLGIPLVSGRGFTAADTPDSTRVVVINEAFARRFFPGEDPIGKAIVYSARSQGDSRQVVGVVGDVRHFALGVEPVAEFYTPQSQDPSYHTMTVAVRAAGDALSLVGPIRTAIAEQTPNAPIYNVRMLDALVSTSVAAERFRTLLLSLFAGLALLLAIVGTYGVVSAAVTARAREMGIRLALGAQPPEVLRLVLTSGLKLVLGGMVLGIAGAVVLSNSVSSLLFGVEPADPVAFASAATVILVTGVLAIFVPARRASRVDPASALRAE